MNTRINTTVSVGIIVLLVAMVGFYITLDVSPQIAYARLFIDLGLAVGLIAVILGFYREKPLSDQGLIHGLNQLKQGKYDMRISPDGLDKLVPLAVAINELARILDENHQRQENIKKSLREELLPKAKMKENLVEYHSIHPELGPVIPLDNRILPKISLLPKSSEKVQETQLSNILVDSHPPKNSSDAQDLEELYLRFLEVQKEKNLEEIEYDLFLKTILRSKEVLMAEYNCSQVLFDVVFEKDEVALQPKIIR